MDYLLLELSGIKFFNFQIEFQNCIVTQTYVCM